MTNPDWSIERRDAVLATASKIAEKCRDENRELSSDEADQVNAAVAEAKQINERHAGRRESTADYGAARRAGYVGIGSQSVR